MHGIHGEGTNRMGKMVRRAEIKAISRRAPELPLSPGWVATLDIPRNRQGDSWLPLITVYREPPRFQAQFWPSARFT